MYRIWTHLIRHVVCSIWPLKNGYFRSRWSCYVNKNVDGGTEFSPFWNFGDQTYKIFKIWVIKIKVTPNFKDKNYNLLFFLCFKFLWCSSCMCIFWVPRLWAKRTKTSAECPILNMQIPKEKLVTPPLSWIFFFGGGG